MITLDPETLKGLLPGVDSVEPCFASGGFKSVYAAVINGKREALKILSIRKMDDPDPDIVDAYYKEQVARVRREVVALGKCRIPELVRLGAIAPMEFDVGGQKYIAYSEEFLDGQDLWTLIRSHGQLPPLMELVQLFRSLLKSVQELWRHGYVHRDIKPQNVMKLQDRTRPFVLLDLGIAYAVHETGLTFGAEGRMPPATYRYLAPEMMQPDFREHIDFRTDLYTIGMTVFEYAAGCHPLARDGDDVMRTISRALRQPPQPLRKYRQDLPGDFCALVDGLLKKKPALRPANLALLFTRLEAIQ
jgi:serine/threonine protein kinase